MRLKYFSFIGLFLSLSFSSALQAQESFEPQPTQPRSIQTPTHQTPSTEAALEALRSERQSLQTQLEVLTQANLQLEQQLTETTDALAKAEGTTQTKEQTVQLLTQQLQQQPKHIWQDSMVLGAILAFAGLVLGLLLPALLPQKRRTDRWM